MSYLEYRKLLKPDQKVSKMRNIITSYQGHKFHSKKEVGYYQHLQGLKAVGEVKKIEKQVRYKLAVNKALICTYVLDFKVTYKDRIEYVDVKPWDKKTGKFMLTPIYQIKKKLMKAIHGINLIEV